MDGDEYDKKCSAIKLDLSTSSLTQLQIAKKHDINIIQVNQLNTGKLKPELEPKTPTQISREKERTQEQDERQAQTSVVKLRRIDLVAKEIPITVSDQKALDVVLKKITDNTQWPKTIILPTTNEQEAAFCLEVLEELQRHLQFELSLCRLKIHALETGDYSYLSEKLIEEMLAPLELEKAKAAFEEPESQCA